MPKNLIQKYAPEINDPLPNIRINARVIEIKNIVTIARGEWGGGSGERGL